MNRYHALIVDDEADIRELVEITLGRMGIDSHAAPDLDAAIKAVDEKDFDLCITDMRLPDGEGIELVKHIASHHPMLPVAVITAFADADTAVNCLKAGAFDYVSKPVDLKSLRQLVDTALKLKAEHEDTIHESSYKLLGNTPSIRTLRKTIDKLARSQAPVHVTGESGTGKELVARLIHEEGPRVDAPFIAVNCGAIPTELMESEFFGHRKGSFTGAMADKTGLFQAADGGTLFLDEVADLPLHMQVKLLRAIQERAVKPIGAQEELKIDVRIISATHKDLASLISSNDFRQDLYYRLNVIEVTVPPLRDRPDDIPELCDHILSRIADQNDLHNTPTLSDDALDALKSHDFMGNIRELENILERAVTMCDGDRIVAEDLNLKSGIGPQSTTRPVSTDISELVTNDASSKNLDDQVEDMERQAIVSALVKTRYNKTQAAKLLGLSFRQLRYRLEKLGIK